MKKENWIWMPHAAHFILGNRCQFHLATYVGGYVVSTVGELWSDRTVQEIHARIYDFAWYTENMKLRGDDWEREYMKKFGFEEIGCDRKYETMVFKAKKSPKCKACEYVIKSGDNVDFDGYNEPALAYQGHLNMCDKWSK